MGERTKTPWVKQKNADYYTHILRTEDGKFVVQLSQTEEGRANAEFICLAVNNHDKLVAALLEERTNHHNYNLHYPSGDISRCRNETCRKISRLVKSASPGMDEQSNKVEG